LRRVFLRAIIELPRTRAAWPLPGVLHAFPVFLSGLKKQKIGVESSSLIPGMLWDDTANTMVNSSASEKSKLRGLLYVEMETSCTHAA